MLNNVLVMVIVGIEVTDVEVETVGVEVDLCFWIVSTFRPDQKMVAQGLDESEIDQL